MYIIFEAFDDNTAIVLNTSTYERVLLTEKQLIDINKTHDVLGLSAGDRSIHYIKSYAFLAFESEESANEYIKEHNYSYQNKTYENGMWWYFQKTNYVSHVDYYVVTYRGEEITYVGEKINYTPYIQSAKKYTKHEAGKTAALMNQRSKTGTKWTTLRVVNR